jgi:glycosyltransferase involved in cell wall biosynthesis
MAIRVLLLTQWFDPEPAFKGMVFARELVRQGFDVEVVTGFPNYPGGKLYPGYKMRLLQREHIDGVSVTRVPLYPSHNNSAVHRILNYVSFAASALIYILFAARRPELIYVYHPPLTVPVVAAVVRLFRRVTVVLDIQDMWPDTLQATGMFSNPHALRLVSRVCDWVYRNVDHIVVLSPGFKRLLAERGVSTAKVDVVLNWCDEAQLTTTAGGDVRVELPAAGSFRIVFAGNLGKAQVMDAVLEAAELLRERAPKIHFILVGSGVEVERLKQKAGAMRLPNLTFVARVSLREVGMMMRQADALLVHLRNEPLFEITIPSKTQAYMAIGKPILMAVNGDAEDLVRKAGCGVHASPEHPEAIAAAATALFELSPEALTAMGDRGRQFYRQELSLRVGAEKFADIFRRTLADSRTRNVQ